MGNGAHNGSAPGKGVCTLPHTLTCSGGIVEDASWAPCPEGYMPGLLGATGFEQTLHQADFGPPHSSTRLQLQGAFQPNFSTPLLAGQVNPEQGPVTSHPGVGHESHPQTLPRQSEHQPGNTPQSAPHLPTGSHQPFRQSVTLDPSSLPHHVQLIGPIPQQNTGSQEPVPQQGDSDWTQRLRARPDINYNEDTAIDLTTSAERGQEQAASLRARNQAANQAAAHQANGIDFPFTINDLRSDPDRRRQVEGDIQVIRQDIPSVSAAQSAQPLLDDIPPQPRVQTAPYQFMGYQLPGVQPLIPQPRNQIGPYQMAGDVVIGGQHNLQTGGPHPHNVVSANQLYQPQPSYQQQSTGYTDQHVQNGNYHPG
jgi:hypothetical protein